jgi:uncharacterized protein YlxP (DUF503 family)
MHTIAVKLTFYLANSYSLKDKRQVRRSLIDKIRQKFNVSIAEVDTQESHKILTIGAALVSGDAGHARQSMDEIINFMDEYADAELTEVEEF